MSATVYTPDISSPVLEYPVGTLVRVKAEDGAFDRYTGREGVVLSIGGTMRWARPGATDDRLLRVRVEGIEKVVVLGTRNLELVAYTEADQAGLECPSCGIGQGPTSCRQWYCRCCGSSLSAITTLTAS